MAIRPLFSIHLVASEKVVLCLLYYVLTMEVLAANLRSHSDIVGICLPNLSSPLPVVSLYADDTSAIVISDSGVKAVFDVKCKVFGLDPGDVVQILQ